MEVSDNETCKVIYDIYYISDDITKKLILN